MNIAQYMGIHFHSGIFFQEKKAFANYLVVTTLLQPSMVVTCLLQGWIMAMALFARCPQPCEVVTTLYDGCEMVIK